MTRAGADPGGRSHKARRSGLTGRRAEWLAILWLTAKGYLEAQKEARRFVYTTRLEEPESLKQEVEGLLSRICSRKIPNLLAYLIEKTPMIGEDQAMLEEVLREKQPAAEVPCDCYPGQCTCHLHDGGTILSKHTYEEKIHEN